MASPPSLTPRSSSRTGSPTSRAASTPERIAALVSSTSSDISIMSTTANSACTIHESSTFSPDQAGIIAVPVRPETLALENSTHNQGPRSPDQIIISILQQNPSPSQTAETRARQRHNKLKNTIFGIVVIFSLAQALVSIWQQLTKANNRPAALDLGIAYGVLACVFSISSIVYEKAIGGEVSVRKKYMPKLLFSLLIANLAIGTWAVYQYKKTQRVIIIDLTWVPPLFETVLHGLEHFKQGGTSRVSETRVAENLFDTVEQNAAEVGARSEDSNMAARIATDGGASSEGLYMVTARNTTEIDGGGDWVDRAAQDAVDVDGGNGVLASMSLAENGINHEGSGTTDQELHNQMVAENPIDVVACDERPDSLAQMQAFVDDVGASEEGLDHSVVENVIDVDGSSEELSTTNNNESDLEGAAIVSEFLDSSIFDLMFTRQAVVHGYLDGHCMDSAEFSGGNQNHYDQLHEELSLG